MCANFASCSKDDDAANTDVGGNDEGGNQEVTVSEKKLVKMVSNEDTYTFSYDDEGRLSSVTEIDIDGNTTRKYEYQFIWGDNAIKEIIRDDDGDEQSCTFILTNGLVQTCDGGNDTFSYNSSNRLIKIDYKQDYYDYRTEVIWDKDKLVSIVDYYNGKTEYDTTFTYGATCKKGYYPLIPDDVYWDLLFVAHPEIAGMRTTQLPTTYTERNAYNDTKFTTNISYEFDKEGYISKIKYEYKNGNSYTYTLTWK